MARIIRYLKKVFSIQKESKQEGKNKFRRDKNYERKTLKNKGNKKSIINILRERTCILKITQGSYLKSNYCACFCSTYTKK